MKKVMIYITEDQKSYGYKKENFDFQKGKKVVNRETQKGMVSLGTFELDQNACIRLHQMFQSLKRVKTWTIPYKAVQLAEFAGLTC